MSYWSSQADALKQTALQQGGALQSQFGNFSQEQMDLFRNLYGPMLENWNDPSAGLTGQYGFSSDTLSKILDPSMQGNLSQYASSLNDLLPSDWQQQLMTGAGDDIVSTARNASDLLYGSGDDNAAAIRGAAGGLQGLAGQYGSQVSGAFNPSDFDISSDFENLQDSALTGEQQGMQGALGDEASQLGGAVNDPSLGLSGDFSQNFQFGPEAQQEIASAAGADVGGQYQSLIDQAQRQAAAEGNTSPLAVASAAANLEREGAANAADAMLKARISARQLGLQTTQQREQMRLGSAQDISSRKMQAGEVLGTARTNAAESLAQSQLGTAQAEEQMRLGGAGQRAGLQLGAAEYGGGLGMEAGMAGLTSEEQLAQQQQQAREFGGQLNVGAMTQKSQEQQQAGQTLFNANQQARQNYFNQQFGANQASAGRYMTAEQASMQQQNAYRDWLTNQTNQNRQMGLAGLQGQTQAFGTTMGAANQAAQNGIQAAAQPGLFSKIFGGILGAAQSAGTLMAGIP